MLSSEEAEIRLEAIANPAWRDQAHRRIRRIRRRLRGTAADFLAEEPTGARWSEWEAFQGRIVAAGAALDKMSDRQRLAICTALHPNLGPLIAKWWVDAQSQPYGSGAGRRAFRAPNRPAITRPLRSHTLRRMIARLGPYQGDAEWLASWAPHLAAPGGRGDGGFASAVAGPLLASAIDAGRKAGDAVYRRLLDVANGDDPVGVMGRHVIVAFLRCGRPDAWEYIERLLLAAQRQEGLRQTILEAVDEAHPEAFERMLRVLADNDLFRFAATVRAACVWLGFPADVTQVDQITLRIDRLGVMLRDPRIAELGASSGDGWDTYLGLCAMSMRDVEAALPFVANALASSSLESRAVAVRFWAVSGLSVPPDVLAQMLADPDLRIAAGALARFGKDIKSLGSQRVAVLERLIDRLPEKPEKVADPGIDLEDITLSRTAAVTALVRADREIRLEKLLRWLPWMDADARYSFAIRASDGAERSPELRRVLLSFVGDRSSSVRDLAVRTISKVAITESEAPELERLMTRSSSQLRSSVLRLLASQPQPAVVRSVRRLWDAGKEAQRDAACELLASCDQNDAAVAELARWISEQQPTERQVSLLGTPGASAPHAASSVQPVRAAQVALSQQGAPATQFDAGLGLYDQAGRAPVSQPTRRSTATREDSARAFAIVGRLDDLAHAHRDEQLELRSWRGSTEVLLGDVRFLPSPFGLSASDAENASPVLAEVFEVWWTQRPSELRGSSDGLDALHALAVARASKYHQPKTIFRDVPEWSEPIVEKMIGGRVPKLRHPVVVLHVLSWMLAKNADAQVVDEAMNAVETLFASIPDARIAELPRQAHQRRAGDPDTDWRRSVWNHQVWGEVVSGVLASSPQLFTQERMTRWFGLLRWLDEPVPGVERYPIPESLTLRAHAAGIATDHDVYDAMFVPYSRALSAWTRRRRISMTRGYPAVVGLADSLRQRILDIEMARGDMPTVASRLAARLGSIEGGHFAFELLKRLGRTSLVTGWIGTEAKNDVFSHLLRVSFPAPTDTAESLQALASSLKLPERSLIDLAVFAPQWAALIEQVLGWDGLADGVWWYHAHAKDDGWRVPVEVRESWAAMSAELTAVSSEDLVAGVVDVQWFERARARLGADRWAVLHKSSKLTSGGRGARRAQLYASAMLGTLDEKALTEKVEVKRNQDSVRAFGLLRLPDDPQERAVAALDRYQRLQDFKRGSRQFGAQRRASEATAVRVATENLARMLGYDGADRFVWAMEAAQAGDLADGPVSVVEDDVTVTLSIDADGVPQLGVRRGEKALAAVPAKLRKVPSIAELRDRKTALKRQASRVRASLESAMVNQERFEAADLSDIGRHPVVAASLNLLVFIDEAEQTMRRDGDAFWSATREQVTPVGAVRIAHPVDLVGGDWVAWQEQLFVASTKQPFKQVFRELYVATEAERSGDPRSERWEGHQVQPQQASALFGSRGWLVDYRAGDVSKAFHSHNVVARVTFANGFGTASEVELPVIEYVCFTRPGEYVSLPIDQVPSVVFSEAMRDVDLVVSVAHAGGVDPEASASTMEMRETLVRETARLMKLDNVRMVGHHVIIEGVLGEYSVHLGSATVHRRPGGALCIIPVAAQRRGRLFLPFADDDPKSAELLSKVLLLAKDSTIKDPSILEQLRS